MSLLPPHETNSLERELNFLKQTISALREQLEQNLDLHDSELQSLEENYRNKETNLHSVIEKLREDYDELTAKQNNERQLQENSFAKERKSLSDLISQLRQKLEESKDSQLNAVQQALHLAENL